MKREDFVKAFSEMSAEDQEAVRAEIMAKGASQEACCSGPMKEQLQGMVEKMGKSDDPMAMCGEMMRMCSEKMKEKCCQ